MGKVQIRKILLHVLLYDLSDILHALRRGLRRVGERLPPAVHLGQGPLERGRRPWGLAPRVLLTYGRHSGRLGRAVRRNVVIIGSAKGGRGEQAAGVAGV